MHIAFVVSTFPSLSHTFIDSQIRNLVERGHRVSVHAFNPPANTAGHDYWEDLGSRVSVSYGTRAPTRGWKRLVKAIGLAPFFAREPAAWASAISDAPAYPFERRLDAVYWLLPLLSTATADVLVCHFGDIGIRALNVRRLRRQPRRAVVLFHGADMTRFVQANGPNVYDELFRQADLFLPISERWKERLLELGCPPGRLRVHRMGVDCAQFTFLARAVPSQGPIRLLSIARLVEKKGIEYAIRAIATIPRPLRERIEYRISGDGPLTDSLAALAASLGVDRQVLMLGWQDQAQVVESMEQAHLMLVPSVTAHDGDQEGIPVVAMEAMASGLPVVATRHSGIPELIEDRVNGRLVAERDDAALALAVVELLEDPQAYADYATAARATVVSRFNQEVLNAEFERLLEALSSTAMDATAPAGR